MNLLLGQIGYLKKELDEKNNIIPLLKKTRKPYLIQEQNVFYNTKDDVSIEKVSSNSNVVIFNNISNNSNDINNTNMTVNADDVSDITIVDSPQKDVPSISEQLKNIRAEHHFKYLESKRNKDTGQKDDLSMMTPQINGQKVPPA